MSGAFLELLYLAQGKQRLLDCAGCPSAGFANIHIMNHPGPGSVFRTFRRKKREEFRRDSRPRGTSEGAGCAQSPESEEDWALDFGAKRMKPYT